MKHKGQHKRDLKMNRSLKTHSTSNASIYIALLNCYSQRMETGE